MLKEQNHVTSFEKKTGSDGFRDFDCEIKEYVQNEFWSYGEFELVGHGQANKFEMWYI